MDDPAEPLGAWLVANELIEPFPGASAFPRFGVFCGVEDLDVGAITDVVDEVLFDLGEAVERARRERPRVISKFLDEVRKILQGVEDGRLEPDACYFATVQVVGLPLEEDAEPVPLFGFAVTWEMVERGRQKLGHADRSETWAERLAELNGD